MHNKKFNTNCQNQAANGVLFFKQVWPVFGVIEFLIAYLIVMSAV